jgi:hypothetical protein
MRQDEGRDVPGIRDRQEGLLPRGSDGMLFWMKLAALISRFMPAPSLKLSSPQSGGTL